MFWNRSQSVPQPTRCHACGTWAAEAICHQCMTERPAYTAVKNMTALPAEAGVQPIRKPIPPCIYYPAALCSCNARGTCMDAV